jgi:hypothetical protein
MLVRRLMLERKQTMQPDNRDKAKLLLQAQQRQQDQRTKTKKKTEIQSVGQEMNCRARAAASDSANRPSGPFNRFNLKFCSFSELK